MMYMITRAPDELPAEVALFARRAFVQICQSHKDVTVPLEYVSACTYVNQSGEAFLALTWWADGHRKALAKGRFYPPASGGRIVIHSLHTAFWVPVPVNPRRRYIFDNVDGEPVLLSR